MKNKKESTITKIILESRFTPLQKSHILLTIGASFIMGNHVLTRFSFNHKEYIIPLLGIMLYSLVVCLAFIRRGLLKKESDLYRGLFFCGNLLLKKKIHLTGKTKVSMLKCTKKHRPSWVVDANPDVTTFKAFDVALLNDKHIEKEILFTLRKNTKVQNTIGFLTDNFNLEHEIYSPDFS